jgi:hypothetical protein
MKVIYTMKNILIQEFQHCLESKQIEVMKMKRLLIQFALIVKVIQMKLMKVTDNMKNILIQEFQHCLEPKLIEVMKMKMHLT